MGLTAWTGAFPKRTDVEVAKNYLSEDEVDTLNRIVNLYLDFAELQAKHCLRMLGTNPPRLPERKPMMSMTSLSSVQNFSSRP